MRNYSHAWDACAAVPTARVNECFVPAQAQMCSNWRKISITDRLYSLKRGLQLKRGTTSNSWVSFRKRA